MNESALGIGGLCLRCYCLTMAATMSDDGSHSGATAATPAAGVAMPAVDDDGVGLGSAYDVAAWVTHDGDDSADIAAQPDLSTVSAYDAYDAWDGDFDSDVNITSTPSHDTDGSGPGAGAGASGSGRAGTGARDSTFLAWLDSIRHRNWSKEFQAVLTKPTDTPSQRLDKVVAMCVLASCALVLALTCCRACCGVPRRGVQLSHRGGVFGRVQAPRPSYYIGDALAGGPQDDTTCAGDHGYRWRREVPSR